MAIITRSAPRGAATVLAANLTDMLRTKRVPHGMKHEMHPETVAHSEPHPVYVATLDDLAAGPLVDFLRHELPRAALSTYERKILCLDLSSDSSS